MAGCFRAAPFDRYVSDASLKATRLMPILRLLQYTGCIQPIGGFDSVVSVPSVASLVAS